MCITRKIPFYLLVFSIQILLLLFNASKASAATTRVDICTLCRCGNETGIEKVHCDFIEDKVSHRVSYHQAFVLCLAKSIHL